MAFICSCVGEQLKPSVGCLLNLMTQIRMDRKRRAFELVGSGASALVMGLLVYEMNQSSVTSAQRNPWVLVINLVVSSCCYLGLFGLFDGCLPLYIKNFRLNWLAISLFGTLLSFIALTSPSWWAHRSFDVEYLLAALSVLSALTVVMLIVMLFIIGIGSLARFILKEIEAQSR